MIGVPAVTIEPDTCTELAPSAAAFAAATISAGDFDATPLPEEEPPQPPSAASDHERRPPREESRRRKAPPSRAPDIGERVG